MLSSIADFITGVIPGHPVWSYIVVLAVGMVLATGSSYFIAHAILYGLKAWVFIVAITFDKERRDEFLGFGRRK